MNKVLFALLIATLIAISACTQRTAPVPQQVDWQPLVNDENAYQAARQKCSESPASEAAADPWCNAVRRAMNERNKKMTRKKYKPAKPTAE